MKTSSSLLKLNGMSFNIVVGIDMSDRNIVISGGFEKQFTELTQKFAQQQKELTEQKIKTDQIQAELDEQLSKQKSRLSLEVIQLKKVTSRAEWLEHCLSYSNFAPLTILLRIGGQMSLKALAKSVGMDPIVLNQQLQSLISRDLVDVRGDGDIVANLPPTN